VSQLLINDYLKQLVLIKKKVSGSQHRSADHKEKVVNLLQRVTNVSVETVKITEAMKAVAR
jgi:predicted helicase